MKATTLIRKRVKEIAAQTGIPYKAAIKTTWFDGDCRMFLRIDELPTIFVGQAMLDKHAVMRDFVKNELPALCEQYAKENGMKLLCALS